MDEDEKSADEIAASNAVNKMRRELMTKNI